MDFRKSAIYLILAVLVSSGISPVWANIGGGVQSAGSGVQVANLAPIDMATEVAFNAPIVIEFSGVLSGAFYQNVNVSLFLGGRQIDGDLFYNPGARQVMFKARAPLAEGKTYTAQVSYHDPAGGTAEKTWSFRTKGGAASNSGAMQSAWQTAVPGAVAPIAAPAVITQAMAAPAGAKLAIINANMGAGMLNSGSPLEITFSEPLDLGSLKEAPIKLFHGKAQLGVDYKLSRDLKTITLVSRNTLRPGPGYSIVVGNQLSGSNGGRIPKNMLIPFKITESDVGVEVPANVIEEAPPEEPASQVRPVNPFSGNREAFANPAIAPRAASQMQGRAEQPAGPHLKVVAMSPRNGETVTNLGQPITVAFNNEIRQETLNEFTFRLEDDFGPVPAKIKYFPGRKQALLTPVGVLDSQKSYRVLISNGVTDVSGQAMQNSLSASFLTASQGPSPAPQAMKEFPGRPSVPRTRKTPPVTISEAETSRDSRELEVIDDESASMEERAPAHRSEAAVRQPVRRERLTTFKVTGIKPSANCDRVPRNSKIVVQFSEPAHPSTVNNISLAVFGNQKRVEGRVVYDSGNRRAIFIPSESLYAETQYRVVLSDKIRSMGGEPLVGRYSWQFQTEGERRGRYAPGASVDSDAEFSIPLLDRKPVRKISAVRRAADSPEKAGRNGNFAGTGNSSPTTSTSFAYLPANHWVFKSIRHMSQKGLLTTYPFKDQTKISRYECAMAVRNALGNLKGIQGAGRKPGLKVGDLVELEHLVAEFRTELKSFGTDPSWFEKFLEGQGVRISEIEKRVNGNRNG